MVIRLAESLGLPLRERNELLLKAGYAPAYPQTPLDGPDLAPVLAALTHILGHLRGNAYRLALHPDGMAPRIANFADWARHVLHAIAAELARNPDERLAALHAELARYVPPARVEPGHLGFAVPLQLRTPHGELRLMTTISTLATAVDVTISELKLEAFLPAGQATATAPGPGGRAARAAGISTAMAQRPRRCKSAAVLADGRGDPPVEGPVAPSQGDAAAQVQVGEDGGEHDGFG